VRLPQATHPYIPMRRGFVYLAAVLDWETRRVLAWQLSNSMTVDFCLEAVDAAIRDYGVLEILNTDQGRLTASSPEPPLSTLFSSTVSRSDESINGSEDLNYLVTVFRLFRGNRGEGTPLDFRSKSARKRGQRRPI
jgi:hypothetical protein